MGIVKVELARKFQRQYVVGKGFGYKMGLLETFNEEYIYRGDLGYKVDRKVIKWRGMRVKKSFSCILYALLKIS